MRGDQSSRCYDTIISVVAMQVITSMHTFFSSLFEYWLLVYLNERIMFSAVMGKMFVSFLNTSFGYLTVFIFYHTCNYSDTDGIGSKIDVDCEERNE